MLLNRFFTGSIGRSLAELVLIVAGVLIALWVDEWRSDRQEQQALRQHLVGMIREIDDNRFTMYKVRDEMIPVVNAALEEIIRTLDGAGPEVGDPDRLIVALIVSTRNSTPWFTHNSFEAFRTSDAWHSEYIRDLAPVISDAFEAPDVLFDRQFADDDDYAVVVNGLIPARYQSEFNTMRAYVSRDGPRAPVIADDGSAQQAVEAIVANRVNIVRLARFRAERNTARWYAITRILWEYQGLRETILEHPMLEGVPVPETEQTKIMDAKKIVF